MDVAALIERMRRQPWYAGQLVHVETLPTRAGRFATPRQPLPPALSALLAARGIEQLYTHQVAALELARVGQPWVVVSGTASGKTLCYHLPILEAALADPEARALYLYPTKALAQDQLKGLLELLSGDEALHRQILAGVYDGDTPTPQRRRIKAEAQLVLSNPDMLHASVLPYHPKWSRFFSELRYVVLDEVHNYRGILGAHVACVLRRLARVCAHYGSNPVLLAASATIANPGELVSRLIGQEATVIDDDGAPRGRKYFALWNPAPLGNDQLARRSATDDAVEWLSAAVLAGGQALAFARTRQATELLHRYTAERLTAECSPLAAQVRAYRGGYLPNERREIEAGLASGSIRGVAATNALELGVDIGSLDVSLLVGYPGTIASTWQQAGRSGRRQGESLTVLLAGNDPIDQYLLRHPDYFFAQSPEHAAIDPENPYVLTSHLRAAAFELPLAAADTVRFGELAEPITELLVGANELNEIGGRRYFAGDQNPSARINLRHMSDNTFAIVLRRAKARPGEPPPVGRRRRDDGPLELDHEVIANVDAISAPELIYPEAVYLHHGEPYFVRELDLEGKVAYVERHEMDYYTQAVLESRVKLGHERQASAGAGDESRYGDLEVSWQTVAFKKIKFNTRENLGLGPVNIPAQTLPSTGLWMTPAASLRAALRAERLRTSEALVGLRNLALTVLPLVAMCDSRDLGGVVDSQNLGASTLILYDRYPGGLGYCEKAYHQRTVLWRLCRQLVDECPCDQGCPSCVGLPNLRPAIHSDPDLSRGYPIPDKRATQRLLALLVEAAESESTSSDSLRARPAALAALG